MVSSARTDETRESTANRDLSGADIRLLLAIGTSWLEHNAAAVNALNVFPVPDGDTGTNMVLTMKEKESWLEFCEKKPLHFLSLELHQHDPN